MREVGLDVGVCALRGTALRPVSRSASGSRGFPTWFKMQGSGFRVQG